MLTDQDLINTDYQARIAALEEENAALVVEVTTLQDIENSLTASRQREQVLKAEVARLSAMETEAIASIREQALEYRTQAIQSLRKIEALEPEVALLTDKLLTIDGTLAVCRDQIAILSTPCQCDPPGSGKHCNGCWRVKASLIRQMAENSVYGPVQVLMAIFDQAVIEVARERNTDGET